MNTQCNLFTPVNKPTRTVRVEFDGGTPCNNPSKGYGIGYGSFRFNNELPTMVSHEVPCSNNAAEVLTLCVALETLAEENADAPSISVLVIGDSEIALNALRRVTGERQSKKKVTGSELFKSSIERLSRAVTPFAEVKGQWQPRAKSVATFGH